MFMTRPQGPKLELLSNLSNMLRNDISDDQFQMFEWWNDCGTIGCAIGWGIEKGILPGLKLAKVIDQLSSFSNGVAIFREGSRPDIWESFDEIGCYFQIHSQDARHLFLGTSYELIGFRNLRPEVSRYKVADRIDAFIASEIAKQTAVAK